VRTDDDRDARLEAHLDRIGEALETADADRTQVHARRRLSIATDVAERRGRRRPPRLDSYSLCAIPRICSRDMVPTISGCFSWTCCSTFPTSSSSDSPRTVSPHGQSTFIAILPPLGRRAAPCYAASASRSSASRAAACSAAFFERPVPTPASTPSITAAQVNVRSCGGPVTSSTEYETCRPRRASSSWSSVLWST